MQVNLSGIFLRDFMDLKFDVMRDLQAEEEDNGGLSQQVLSTVGLRHATTKRSVSIHNSLGVDILVQPESAIMTTESGYVPSGKSLSFNLDRETGQSMAKAVAFTLRVADSATRQLGQRFPVFDLPLPTAGSCSVFLLKPACVSVGDDEGLPSGDGRASPETATSDITFGRTSHYDAEPIVEYCVQNQRLKTNVGDVADLTKGRDILSSTIWSPDDDYIEDIAREDGRSADAYAGMLKSNWSQPYLKDDAPEWSDMTSSTRIHRDQVALPDSNWMWLNEWTVEVEGNLSDQTDSDGWEYHADFETFTRVRRYYQKGDCCRRRVWTRTRMPKPSKLGEVRRLHKLVWETSIDGDGNHQVSVRSHLRITNETATDIRLFLSHPGWDSRRFAGVLLSGETMNVPLDLASAIFMSLAAVVTGEVSEEALSTSKDVLIVHSNKPGSRFVRGRIETDEIVSSSVLHFLVEIRSSQGTVDISIKPTLRVVNLLPCELECHLGEVARPGHKQKLDTRPVFGSYTKQMVNSDSLRIPIGKEKVSVAVSPWQKPHISLRVSHHGRESMSKVTSNFIAGSWLQMVQVFSPGQQECEVQHLASKRGRRRLSLFIQRRFRLRS